MIAGSRADRYVEAADRALREAYVEPMGLAEYVEAVFEQPRLASHASKYLFEAITSMGTRTALEAGRERERYRFFDDPMNDGEHAVLGNAEMLAGFVADLRAIAAGRGRDESIIWFAGPTATGKSELKRCLINGLREYSKTPEGRRYSLQWNLDRTDEGRGLSYGELAEVDAGTWLDSPVQAHPLSVFPRPVRDRILAAVNEGGGDGVDVRIEGALDPFSAEAYDELEGRYRRTRESALFSSITDERHLRVSNYVVDVGRGIGVLHAEDGGTVKERLVGGWMPELLRELDSRGRKNPQAFSYDGVLSQGNNGVTIVEDASQHADLLQKLLTVPEEGRVKLDMGVGMDVDTQLIIISNPDLEALLDQHEKREGKDPLKALKRRLDRRRFAYLTTLHLEVQLVRRELAGEHAVWTFDRPEAAAERVREPVTVTVRDGDGATRREFAPHAIEAAAMYDVVSRLDVDALPGDLDPIETALLYDRGVLHRGDERLSADDLDLEAGRDGEHGIPVTYTRDVLAALLSTPRDRTHETLPVDAVVMPADVLDAMVEGLADAPVFSTRERREYGDLVEPVRAYVDDELSADVLDAMLERHRVDEATVAEYVEHAVALETDEPVAGDDGVTVEPDPLVAKVFEIEHLGRFDEDDYRGTEPSEAVEAFRREHVVGALNRLAWERRGADFTVGDVDPMALPVMADVLASDDWDDVRRVFPDFEPHQWEDPPSRTVTARLKEETIDRLGARGYSPAAATLASAHVVASVARRWD